MVYNIKVNFLYTDYIMKNLQINAKNGFTLIELLVVVLIIGILTAIAMPQYQKVVERARMAEAVSNVRALYQANQRYFLATGVNASKMSELDVHIQGSSDSPDSVTTKNFYYSVYPGIPAGVAAYRLPLPKDANYAIFIRYQQGAVTQPASPLLLCNTYSNANDVQKKLCQELNANHSL